MPYQPPFTITADILNLVADISEQVGKLNASTLDASTQLHKQNCIKTITGTLAIEGNTLSEAQVTAIVEGKPVLGSVRELAEVNGVIAAYETLSSLQSSNVDDLLKATSPRSIWVDGRPCPMARTGQRPPSNYQQRISLWVWIYPPL